MTPAKQILSNSISTLQKPSRSLQQSINTSIDRSYGSRDAKDREAKERVRSGSGNGSGSGSAVGKRRNDAKRMGLMTGAKGL